MQRRPTRRIVTRGRARSVRVEQPPHAEAHHALIDCDAATQGEKCRTLVLTPRTAIEIAGRIRGLSGRDARTAATRLAEELDVTPWLDQRALPEGRGLSGGIRRLTAFAMTVAAPTPLLVLDEPTNDIDASRRRLLWDAVRRRGDEGAGVLLVTHNVAEAERIVDDLVILNHGKVVASGSPARLRGTHDGDLRLELQIQPGAADPTEALLELPVTALRLVRTGRRVLLTVPASDAAAAVTWATTLRDQNRLDGYSLGPSTLEDAYLSLTSYQGDDSMPHDSTAELAPQEVPHV